MSDIVKEIWDLMEKENLNPVKTYDSNGNVQSIGISCRYNGANVDISIIPSICMMNKNEVPVYLVNVADFHCPYMEDDWIPKPFYWDLEKFIEECNYHNYRERMEKELKEG